MSEGKSSGTVAIVGKTPAWIPVAAGCVAGGIETISIWPMEYIKTQLQLASKAKPLPYNGMVSGLTWTVKNNGFLGLYRGLFPTLVGSIPKAGIRFGLNAQFKELLRDKKTGKLSPAGSFASGMGAGVAEAVIIVAPVETIKTKCIDMNKPFAEGMKIILAKDGIKGIYLGVGATAMKQGSNQGLRFLWFDKYKLLVTDDGKKPMTELLSLFGGMSAGCFSTLGNNPFDVVKTRLQGTSSHLYSGTVDCFVQIFRNEGFAAFYAGLVPRLGRVVPGQGIIFMCYESLQSQIKRVAGC